MKRSSDHRARVTQAMIREAFLNLLRQKPIQAITVKELCAAANINRGTFYTHYQDIYALLEQIEADLLSDLSASLASIDHATGEDVSLVEICTSIFQCLKENSDLCVVMLGEHSDKRYVDSLLEMGKEACLRAYSRHFQDATPREIGFFYAFVSNGCIGLLHQWIQEGMATPARQIAKMAESIMLHGIGFFRQAHA